MHIPPPSLGASVLLLALISLLFSSTAAAESATSSSPFADITPAPDAGHVARRLRLHARQGPPRSSDGKTGFIGWYTRAGTWVSATCPADDYFAADETYGVCCHRTNPYCDMATSCGGPGNNFAIGPSGQADCGSSNTCDTVTMLASKDSSDARRIVFCIAVSEEYVLPMTWYRVTYPLPQASVAPTVTVTHSEIVTQAAPTGNATAARQPGSTSLPGFSSLAIATAVFAFVAFTMP